ncbi:MAG: hypothetical protein EBS53_09610 [Bacteroidetes bacterium]|nr:hypothetical protein [Bacteroidota bacterium]
MLKTSRYMYTARINNDMTDPRLLGDVAEQKFILLCMQKGINIYKPLNSNSRVDFIIELQGQCKRVQIKYRSMFDGKLSLSATKQQNGRDKALKYSATEIDLFLVYEPSTDQFYNIPMHMYDTNRVNIFRIDAPKNGQCKGVKYLKDYLLQI